MKAREYLLQVSQLRRDIKRLEEEIETIERRMEHLGSMRYDLPRVQGTVSQGYAADLDRKDEKTEELEELLFIYGQKYRLIMEQLNRIPAKESEVLKLYYLDGKKIRQIAHLLHYSPDRIYHIYASGLKSFDQIINR